MTKSTLWARTASVLGLVWLVGCGSDGTGPGLHPDFTALIDGEPFQATTARAERVGGGVGIEADDDSSRGMGFEFQGLSPGTYTPYRAEVNLGLSVWLSYEDVGSRSVTVTTFTSERIAGTFELTLVSGSGTDTVWVTDGRFDLAF